MLQLEVNVVDMRNWLFGENAREISEALSSGTHRWMSAPLAASQRAMVLSQSDLLATHLLSEESIRVLMMLVCSVRKARQMENINLLLHNLEEHIGITGVRNYCKCAALE